jgi:hypothetical protein
MTRYFGIRKYSLNDIFNIFCVVFLAALLAVYHFDIELRLTFLHALNRWRHPTPANSSHLFSNSSDIYITKQSIKMFNQWEAFFLGEKYEILHSYSRAAFNLVT